MVYSRLSFFFYLYLTRQVSWEQILTYNDGLPQPNLNPIDAGPIVRCPMRLPITAGCDTTWKQTRSVVTPLALRCSALDRCTTRELACRGRWLKLSPSNLYSLTFDLLALKVRVTERHIISRVISWLAVVGTLYLVLASVYCSFRKGWGCGIIEWVNVQYLLVSVNSQDSHIACCFTRNDQTSPPSCSWKLLTAKPSASWENPREFPVYVYHRW